MTWPDPIPGRLAVAGNQSTTVDVLELLLDHGYDVGYLLAVGPEHRDAIADYVDMQHVAKKHGLDLLRPTRYDLADQASRDLVLGAKIDLLVSVGWQRLFPPWMLEHVRQGIYGMHGSAEGLPRGRGRSPMNWTILEGRDRFYTSLFRYDKDIDSGDIVDTQRFDVRPWDTIRSLQRKNALIQGQLLLKHLPFLLDGTAEHRPQPTHVKATYYPKRTPADGVIDWRDPASRIHRLVRAVTRPYPGAFTWAGDTKVMVWMGAPFDSHIEFSDSLPGDIVAVFHDDTFVVRCHVDSFYVTDWEADGWQPEVGQTLRSENNESWAKLARMYGQRQVAP